MFLTPASTCPMKDKLKASLFVKTLFGILQFVHMRKQFADNNAHSFYLLLMFWIFIADLPSSKVANTVSKKNVFKFWNVFVHIVKCIGAPCEMYLYILWTVFVQVVKCICICFAFSSSTSSREKLQALYQHSSGQRIVWQTKKSHRYPVCVHGFDPNIYLFLHICKNNKTLNTFGLLIKFLEDLFYNVYNILTYSFCWKYQILFQGYFVSCDKSSQYQCTQHG